MSEYILRIPDRLPMSHNKQNTSHWRTRQAERKKWERELEVAACNVGLPLVWDEEDEPRSVQIHLEKKTHQKDDPSNLEARSKHILDALKNLGYIVDDDERSLDWLGVTEDIRCDRKRTIISISAPWI